MMMVIQKRAGALLATWLLEAVMGCNASERPEYNVLLITVDTLRADHVSAYGYPVETTPSLKLLSSQGVLFDQTYSPANITWPSLTSILTSLYPVDHGVRDNGSKLKESVKTMAQYLGEHGYVTVAFITNMLSADHRGFSEVHRIKHAPDGKAAVLALNWLSHRGTEPFFASSSKTKYSALQLDYHHTQQMLFQIQDPQA